MKQFKESHSETAEVERLIQEAESVLANQPDGSNGKSELRVQMEMAKDAVAVANARRREDALLLDSKFTITEEGKKHLCRNEWGEIVLKPETFQ